MELSPEKMPQSRDAEYAALGSVLLDADKLADVRGILRPDHFVDSRLGEIFKSALMLSDSGIAVDAITVRENLLSRGIFADVGGVDILADVLNSVPSAAHAEHYAKLVVEKAKLRRLLQICGDIWRKCFTASNEPDLSSELASSLIAQAQEIRDNGFAESIRTVEQVLVSVIAAKSSHAIERYATGLVELDDLIGGLPIGQMTLVAGKAGMGKAQPLTSIVMTPSGPRTMGDISAGDYVCGHDGKQHRVTAVHPQGLKDVFRVRFSDGAETHCCDDHLWHTQNAKERILHGTGAVRTLRDIRNSLLASGGRRLNHSVVWTDPVEFVGSQLALDPYVLGVFLGDGTSRCTMFTVCNREKDIRNKISSRLPDGDVISDCGRSFNVKRAKRSRRTSESKTLITEMGLWGKKSDEKFIPPQYLTSNIDNRLELLRGLFDTDGYVTDPRGSSVEYTTTSARLRDGVEFLVRSLGGRVTWRTKTSSYKKNGKRIECKDAYRMNVSFNNDVVPVSSNKHLSKWRGISRRMGHFIESVHRLEKQVECKCISLDSPSQLYLTDDFIVTHNSILCKQMAINIARGGIPGGIITVEETAQKIGENYLAGASGISNNKIVYNRLSAEEMSEVVNAVPSLATIPLFIDDAQHKLSDIERTGRRMVRKYGCKFVIVDHLHLIDGEYDGPREQEISRISGGLKKLFKDLGVAGIVCAQMNRGGEGDYESPPELRNLRGSGSLEQDGDLILQLHRQDYYDWKKLGNEFVADHRLRIFVNKNKHGAIGSRDAYFNGDHQTITNWNDGQGTLAHVAYPNIPSFEP